MKQPVPLPAAVEGLLAARGASPRLTAHLMLVHDTAVSLTAGVSAAWPRVTYDRQAVLLGAATHDVGKVVHPEELSGPGHAHEEAGVRLLIESGITERQARFARTHARWEEQLHGAQGRESGLEDLLVALSDKVWKGKRAEALEQATAQIIAARSGEALWQVWLALDDLLSGLAATADERLAWQARHPI
jgi:hypothetical protein